MTDDAFCKAAACCADVEDEGLGPHSGGAPFCEDDTGNQDCNGDDVIEGNVDPVVMVPVCPCCCNNLQQNTASHFKKHEVPLVYRRYCAEALAMPQPHLHQASL